MRFFLPRTVSLACVVLGLQAAEATSQLYINSGSVTNPIVDASGFLNEGYFETRTSLPYETSNTLNYTNRGTMFGDVGFRFHTFTNGFRRRASSFVNETYIQATSGTFFTGGFVSSSPGSYLFINASNVVNPGFLGVGSSGLLRIDGNKANLRGAGILAGDSASASSFSFFFPDAVNDTNYWNDTKVTDRYWGVGTNGAFAGSGAPMLLTQLTRTNSTIHQVVRTSGQFLFTNTAAIGLSSNTQFRAFAYTNQPDASGTSQVIQVVFVSTNWFDTNVNLAVKFFFGHHPWNSACRSIEC